MRKVDRNRRPAAPARGDGRSQATESGVTRRGFLGTVGAGAAVTATAGALGGCSGDGGAAAAGLVGPESPFQRRLSTRDARINQAQANFIAGAPDHVNNGDEDRYPGGLCSFSKCLPHNSIGEASSSGYASLLAALSSGDIGAFDALNPTQAKFHSPQAGLAFETEGLDSHAIALDPAPTFRSAEQAGEMVEDYWMALARDVWFGDYGSHPTIGNAVSDLNNLSDFRGPKSGGVVTSGTVFRGALPGDEVGPYVSQFLLSPFNYGSIRVEQRHRTGVAGVDYMKQVGDGTSDFGWLHVQNGGLPGAALFQQVPLNGGLYIRDLRCLARSVRDDPLYQYFYNAALICLQSGVPLQNGNYYKSSTTQLAFATLGPPFLFEMIARACGQALRAIWFQKWYVHRRLRPEEYAGRVHFHQANQATYELHSDVLNSTALSTLLSLNGTGLLPMAYPEGCPIHPSYGAGHAVVAGAGLTVLKAFFDTSVTLASLPTTAATTLKTPKVASADGLSLVDYTGPDAGQLTVLGELHKLGNNDALGRNAAGMHWRSETVTSMQVGEKVAIALLTERKALLNEPHTYSFTKFDGTPVVI